uniref:Uncharacterized protein n=1 Tax=Lactuca sativa TaxID=4236 RepID=A0A9R1X909_LACSA|nr:hypothetical protein LSAT_V11C500273350 [Lactuca sativa]
MAVEEEYKSRYIRHKYGKVVYKRNDQKSPVAEFDDDDDDAFRLLLWKWQRLLSDVKGANFNIVRVLNANLIFYHMNILYDLAEINMGNLQLEIHTHTNSGTLWDFGCLCVKFIVPHRNRGGRCDWAKDPHLWIRLQESPRAHLQ